MNKFKEVDRSAVLIIIVVVLILSVAFGIPMVQSCDNKDKPKEELIRAEER